MTKNNPTDWSPYGIFIQLKSDTWRMMYRGSSRIIRLFLRWEFSNGTLGVGRRYFVTSKTCVGPLYLFQPLDQRFTRCFVYLLTAEIRSWRRAKAVGLRGKQDFDSNSGWVFIDIISQNLCCMESEAGMQKRKRIEVQK